MKRIILLSLAALFSYSLYADPLLLTLAEMEKLKQYFPAEEDNTHHIWKGDAIAITLPLNQEKRIIFPAKILPDLKGALTTDQLRLINDNKSLYLTAKKAFSHIRLYVSVENSNQVILIDLSTAETGSKSAEYIDFTQPKSPASSTEISTEMIKATETPTPSDNDNYVMLIRFAWQQLYAPERLRNNPLEITRTPMHTDYFVSNLIYGDKVTAHPIASWTYQNNIVTAVELRNKYPHDTRINLSRDVCGSWQAGTLYPRSLLKAAGNEKNKEADSTVLFLISEKPFGEVMGVCNGRP